MKTVISSLLFALVPLIINSQELSDELSFKAGYWSYDYYVGDRQVSLDDFATRLSSSGNQSLGASFKTGKNISITGTVIGSVGAFFAGYDLGTRLGGGKGNTAMLAGGGGVFAGGLILYYIGEGKMKKALKLYMDNSVTLSLHVTPKGFRLSFNF